MRKILFFILSLQILNAVIANSTIIPNGELNYTAFKNSCIEKGSDGLVNRFQFCGFGNLTEKWVPLENVTYFHDISNYVLASGFQCRIL